MAILTPSSSAAGAAVRVPMHPRTQCRIGARGRFRGCLFLAITLAISSVRAAAVEAVAPEYQLKAVFLWRLAQFVQWPTNAFKGTNDPLVIGVIGINPFGNVLDLAVRDETVHNRKIEVRYFTDLAEVPLCHILYVGESEISRVRAITRAVGHRSILTVSDIENFATELGGMIRFMTEQNKIHLRINLEAARASRLILDGRLLRMAEIVPGT